MRYYNITIGSQNPAGGGNSSSPTLLHYTSHPNGPYQPPISGALNVEFDLHTQFGYVIQAGAFIRVWGISVADIAQSAKFGGQPMIVQGGMGIGLPLANPSQSGVLLTGSALQVFGNWQHTDLSLDIIATIPINVSPITAPDQPPPIKNVPLAWPPNTQLSDAIRNALQTAYPNTPVTVNISQKLKQNSDGSHNAPSWTDLNTYVNAASIKIMNDKSYSGVGIAVIGNKFIVTDGVGVTKQIQFQELIGQPTWIDWNVMQFQTVMRADINVGDIVQMPPGVQYITTAGAFGQGSSALSYANYRNASAFGGTFKVVSVRHVGNFRSPDGRAWCTVFETWVNKLVDAKGVSYSPTDRPDPTGKA